MGGKGVKILRDIPVDYLCESLPHLLELQIKYLSYSEQVFGYQTVCLAGLKNEPHGCLLCKDYSRNKYTVTLRGSKKLKLYTVITINKTFPI